MESCTCRLFIKEQKRGSFPWFLRRYFTGQIGTPIAYREYRKARFKKIMENESNITGKNEK